MAFLLAIFALSVILCFAVSQEIFPRGIDTTPAQLLGAAKGSVSINPPHLIRLMLRQFECVDSGYYPCSNEEHCCQAGYGCCSVDCCPDGIRCCNGGGCVYPGGECCGGGFSCPAGSICYGETQCLSVSAVYSTSYSTESCQPVSTEIATTTVDSTISTTIIITITKTTKSEEPPDFTCMPLTVTNRLNATLELDTDCSLSYIPPSTSASSIAKLVPKRSNATLRPRQLSCPPPLTTDTTTMTNTITATMIASKTVTVFAEPSESGFSCPAMTVTNQAGDELSLDESCALDLSLAPRSSTSSSTSSASQSVGSIVPAQTSSKSGEGGLKRAGILPILVVLLAASLVLLY